MLKQLFFLIFLFSFSSVFSQNKTEQYIAKYSQIAIDEMNIYHIPASITLAQGILESGNGESRLATEGKNHFGIKCHDNWNGKTIIEDDDEKGECFRKYSKVSESYRDHSLFLTERGRYSFLFEYKQTDYKKWAKGLKKAGYATNPKYPTLLIDLIEKYDLSRFDKGAKSNKNLYFAHSYGLPYLSGVGAYYFNRKSLYYLEANTSFAFSEANFGYNYQLLSNFYSGANAGIIYLPTKEKAIVPQLSAELMYKKATKNKRFNSVLIRGGVQLPLAEMDYEFVPYLRVTYLLR
ncbi:MAG: glucosaminidase domain-containing protein [Flavobacteriales bacterium]|nr:glucosaminidase domain-containing protein [Flavobacteriales bacterium]